MTPNANLRQLHEAGVSIWLDTLCELEREGVQAFCNSYSELLERIEAEIGAVGQSI